MPWICVETTYFYNIMWVDVVNIFLTVYCIIFLLWYGGFPSRCCICFNHKQPSEYIYIYMTISYHNIWIYENILYLGFSTINQTSRMSMTCQFRNLSFQWDWHVLKLHIPWNCRVVSQILTLVVVVESMEMQPLLEMFNNVRLVTCWL